MRAIYLIGTGVVCLAAASDARAICRRVLERESPPAVIRPDQAVLLVQQPGAVTMVVQPAFSTGEGGARFALLMVTPSPPEVTLAEPTIFDQLAYATAPAVEVYTVCEESKQLGYQCDDPKWEPDSCDEIRRDRYCPDSRGGGGGGAPAPDDGGGCTGSRSGHDSWAGSDAAPGGWVRDAGAPDASVVTVQTVGAYEIAVLGVPDLAAFATWLDAHGYAYGPDDLDAAQPYLDRGWTVVAVRVVADVALEHAALEPIAFTYEAADLQLPLAISRQPIGQSFLTVYVAADGRYDLPGGHIAYARPDTTGGGAFLTRTDLWVDLARTAVDDPIAARIEGDPQHQDTVAVTERVAVPSSCCPAYPDSSSDSWGESRYDDTGVLCGCRSTRHATGSLALIALCLSTLLRRRRPRLSRE